MGENIPCLFSIHEPSGNRKPVERILPKSIIGFMNARPWCGETRDRRRENAIERINQFINSVGQHSDTLGFTADQVYSYASPECIDIEDRYTRIAREKDLEADQQRFMKQYFLPLISTNIDGQFKRIDVDKAKANMRLTLVGFSYGGMFIAGIRKALQAQMQQLGYAPDEIKAVFSQVYQINFGVQRCEADQVEPKFTERTMITRDDAQGIWESYLNENFLGKINDIVMLDNAAEVKNYDGRMLTKAHSQEVYTNAMASRRDLCKEMVANFSADCIEPTQPLNSAAATEQIKEKLLTLDYRRQMYEQRHR
jgi:hypothetical protein